MIITAPQHKVFVLHSIQPSSLLTVGALHVEAGAPTAAPFPAIPTVAFETGSRAAIQTAVLQLPSALDLDSHQPARNHRLKAHHDLLFPERVHKHT